MIGVEWGMKFSRDVLLPIGILSVLLLFIGSAVLNWRIHEIRRPVLEEIRIVSATGSDSVFREGLREISAKEDLRLALALRLNYPGKGDRWISPVEKLVLDGRSVDHLVSEEWPEEDRKLVAFWFTLESPFLGGEILSKEEAAEKLALRPFYAPEMGRAMMALKPPDWHAEDDVDLGENLAPPQSGTFRLYARVHVLAMHGSLHPIFALKSLGAKDLGDPRFPEFRRSLPAETGINPVAGECFRLPGFQISGKGAAADWTRSRRAVSSESFAAMAATGVPSFQEPCRELPLKCVNGIFRTTAGVLYWGRDVAPKDMLRQGKHWMVLIRDEGNGILDTTDIVAQSWKRPPAILPLETVFSAKEGPVFLISTAPSAS